MKHTSKKLKTDKSAKAVANLRANPPKMMSVEEVALFTGTHINTVRRMIRTGRLKVVKIGRRQIVPLSQLESMAAELV